MSTDAKGIIDGATAEWGTLKNFKFAETAKYGTRLNIYCGHSVGQRLMNWNSWNRLPPDIQSIMRTKGRDALFVDLDMNTVKNKEAVETMAKKGLDIYKLTDDQVLQWWGQLARPAAKATYVPLAKGFGVKDPEGVWELYSTVLKAFKE